MVRGRSPMNIGCPIARANRAIKKNCQTALTPPRATIHKPRNMVPKGMSHRGPQRSANGPSKGAVTPDIQTPVVAVKPMDARLQPVSSEIRD